MNEFIDNIKSIIDDGFKIRQDYCSRLEDKSVTKPEQSPTVKTSVGTPTEEEKKKK